MTQKFNFLKRLFGRHKSGYVNDANHVNLPENSWNENHEVDIPRSLFVNDQQPIVQNNFKNQENMTVNTLEKFLNENHFMSGFNDGYKFHQTEIRDNKIMLLKAEFRTLVQERIDDIRKIIHNLEIEQLKIKGLSETTEQSFRVTIGEHQKTIQQLEHEMELSVDGEGMISRVLHNYNDGFLRGVSLWIADNNLTQPSGMLNSGMNVKERSLV